MPARGLPSVPVTRRRWARPAATCGLPLLPGVATGSEIMMCQEDGLTELKFFPAMQAGGAGHAQGLERAVHRHPLLPDRRRDARPMRPTCWRLPNVVCVGGSWLVPADALAQGDWARITHLARAAAQLGRTAT